MPEKNLFVLECERVKKQEYRKKKRNMDEVNEFIDLEETHKKRKNKFDDHRLQKTADQSYFKDIKECIKQFHSNIAVGALFICTCCHQTWFRKGVCMLQNINLPTSSRLYCTKFTSINDEEWICHTCMGAIRDGKVPKLSVANGMKWPDKPPELDLHQLEERLISLRISLYHDTDAEYLCFPTIFCGQRRPSKEERTVPVHYSDIVKWELRSVDKRAAQSVPNIFFKHKKLQMKQISDKINLAVRRCKGKEKKITAAEARNSEYLDKIVKLDEGYCIFRQLRNSLAYLQSRKKDIFAMIRQLSLPTWFMSLSAADTRWTDLLKMLAKLNNGVDYTDKDIEGLTWQEKTKLVQKDPVTCSRYFDHRVQEFLNTILKSNCEPTRKMRDFFYRVEFLLTSTCLFGLKMLRHWRRTLKKK